MSTQSASHHHHSPLCVADDHPAFPGHFPGAPVVPGVLLLSQILDAAEDWLGAAVHPSRLRQVKFPAPWLPGMAVTADLTLLDRQLRFEVFGQGMVLATGMFELAAAKEMS